MSKLVLKGFVKPILGTDPEAFFSKNGKVIGSEKVMPEGGVIYRHGITTLNANATGENKVIMDGVQFELNPLPSQCRESLSANIQNCFMYLENRLKEANGIRKYGRYAIKADFSQLIEVDEDEFASLSGDCKRFGCMPSKNAYNEPKAVNNVDPTKYRIRCAGGHIHIGKTTQTQPPEWNTKVNLADVLKDDVRLIKLMDVIVGNTCVLLDRDPGNVERRKVYGRAGEYRTPPHGIEYRTISNFWLRSYPLFGFVMGLSRLAVNILANGNEYYNAIMEKVNEEDIRKAINENDFELAYSNFNKIEETLLEMIDGSAEQYSHPFSRKTMPMFKHLVKVGIDKYWDKKKVLQHWRNRGGGNGWGDFLDYVIGDELKPKTNNANTSPIGSTGYNGI